MTRAPARAPGGRVTTLLAVFSGVVLFASSTTHLHGQDRSTTESGYPAVPVGLSTHGLPGLLNVPNATALPLGWVDANFNNDLDSEAVSRLADRQYNIQIAFSLFDRLVLSGRGSEVRGDEASAEPFVFIDFDGVVREVERPFLHRDLSANASLLVVKESETWPGLAVGLQDVGGASSFFESRYLVASKSFQERVRLTAGLGFGPDVLDGPFGGVEFAPTDHVTILGEYDANQFNGGVRIRPLPRSLSASGFPQPSVDLLWFENEGLKFSVTLRTILDLDQAREPQPESRAATRTIVQAPSGPDDRGSGPSRTTSALVAAGFENVTTTRAGDRLTVEYENRVYNQHELDGLARVLEIVAEAMPDDVDSVTVVTLQLGLPVVEMTMATDDLRAFLWADLGRDAFRDRAEFRYAATGRAVASSVAPANRSRLKLDLIFRPGVETFGFSDIGIAESRFHLEPNAVMQLWTGGLAEVEYQIPLVQTSNFGLLRGPLPDPRLKRATLRHTERLSEDGGSHSLWVQWSGGRFDLSNVGVRQEALLLLAGGRLSVGADVAFIGNDFEDLDRVFAVARGRYLVPELDTRISVTTGWYLDEDRGITGELSRFFGDTEIGVFLRHSSRGSLAGLRFAIPLTPARDMAPARARVRLPDWWQYSQSSVVFQDRNPLRGDIARSLPSRHGLEDALFDRDRLHPAQLSEGIGHKRFWRR